jgi:hypothetical protein
VHTQLFIYSLIYTIWKVTDWSQIPKKNKSAKVSKLLRTEVLEGKNAKVLESNSAKNKRPEY